MKKILSFICIAVLAFGAVSCKKDNKENKPDVNNITEDGFYVVGEATGQADVTKVLSMAKGINEANNQTLRDGMYEKYIVLEGGKDFTLAYVNGGKQEAYGATLAEFKPAELTGIYESNPADQVFKGKLVVGDAAPKMKVSKTGLYHIVLDLNTNKDLTDAQILLCPVTMGVRGGMNGWGFTALEATEAKNEGITFTLSGQKLADGGEFKFAYNSAWKITLDEEGAVKANTNLGKDCKPGGDNIAVTEGAGAYKITLTFKLAAGDIANSFSYKVEQESKSETPTTMYMIGADFGNWDWASDGVAELVPVWGKEGAFWCTRYFTTNGFKFCALREWNGDFTGLGADEGYTVADGNCFVPAEGFYTVYINLIDKVLEIKPAEVYGIGDAWGGNAWDFNAEDPVKFVAEGSKMVATVTNNSTAVRLASKVLPTVKVEGCVDAGWFDWWKTEFVYFDGKIAYRGGGNDQDRVAVEAGQKITIDFNAGTVEVGEGGPAFVPAITIDGDLAEWADIESVTNGNHTVKFTMDEKYIYIYSHRAKDESFDQLWGSSEGYVYFALDVDKNAETGDQTLWGNGPFEYVGVIWPYGGSATAPVINKKPESAYGSSAKAIPSIACDGVIDETGVALEFCIALEDLPALPADPTASPFILYSWGSTNLAKVEYHVGEEQPFDAAIEIDGDMSDWAEIEGVETPDNICKVMKVTNDAKYFYVYLASAPGSRGAQLWGDQAGYYYLDFDWDNNEETGIAENNNPGFDCWCYLYIFGGTADNPEIKLHPNGSGTEMSIANITAMGVITADLIEIELSIPRADMVAVAAGTETRILSWRSKDGTKIQQIYTVK